MRLSRYHAPTLREAPKEAELPSHLWLIRGGFIRQLSAGIYNLLPMGLRTVQKIEAIVRDEMNRAGGQELLMPSVQPAELWNESGRWEKYGPELQRFQDRKGNDYCLGPTHEEIIVDVVRRDIRSYRQLPTNLYQIQSKFRDEIRPRGGLLRGREFIMKDAYSFDVSVEKSHESYQIMYDTYARIFERCGLEFRAVEADSGNIGGSLSHEFHVLAETGEDDIVACSDCKYAANVEKAGIAESVGGESTIPAAPPTLVETPNKKTVIDVAEFMSVDLSRVLKTLIITLDGEPYAAVVRGDRELNPLKVRDALGAEVVELADEALVKEVTGAPLGFAGPIGLTIPIIVDHEIASIHSGVCGANQADKHYKFVSADRDFSVHTTADIRLAQDGDSCPMCTGNLRAFRGIEVGHVFHLGTKYSEPMGCTFSNKEGQTETMVMGCYGIGITRIMAAAIEQNHDENGICWPLALSPFSVILLPLGKTGDEVYDASERIYAELQAAGVEVLFDDRAERPGVKFADADVLGIPLRITVGRRGLKEGSVEFKVRADGREEKVALDRVLPAVERLLRSVR
jgi:prolyl-tRNA synthetase